MELILTAYRYREQELLEDVESLGEFHSSGFRDVVRGRVSDLNTFLDELEEETIFSLSRVIPIEKSFKISIDDAEKDIAIEVEELLEEIEEGESFAVRVERRGYSEELSSKELEKYIGTYITDALEDRFEAKPEVDLEDPDKAVIIETLGKWCGIGIISKAMRERYSYLKLP
ncbi:MAG: THUMP domain-containing protein [Candidatus Bathyarchaeia archaeon]